MLPVFDRYNSSVLAVRGVPKDQTHLYGIIKGEKVAPGVYKVLDLVEKPQKNAPSNLAIIGRYILTPGVFKAIEKTKPGISGEDTTYGRVKDFTKDGNHLRVRVRRRALRRRRQDRMAQGKHIIGT